MLGQKMCSTKRGDIVRRYVTVSGSIMVVKKYCKTSNLFVVVTRSLRTIHRFIVQMYANQNAHNSIKKKPFSPWIKDSTEMRRKYSHSLSSTLFAHSLCRLRDNFLSKLSSLSFSLSLSPSDGFYRPIKRSAPSLRLIKISPLVVWRTREEETGCLLRLMGNTSKRGTISNELIWTGVFVTKKRSFNEVEQYLKQCYHSCNQSLVLEKRTTRINPS